MTNIVQQDGIILFPPDDYRKPDGTGWVRAKLKHTDSDTKAEKPRTFTTKIKALGGYADQLLKVNQGDKVMVYGRWDQGRRPIDANGEFLAKERPIAEAVDWKDSEVEVFVTKVEILESATGGTADDQIGYGDELAPDTAGLVAATAAPIASPADDFPF